MKTNNRLLSNLPFPLKEHQLEDRFDDYLDDGYETVECMGVTVEPHIFIKTHDETAYRCAFNDWLDRECRDEAIKEYDGGYYYPGDFKTAVADTIREVEDDITSAQESDPARDALTDQVSDLEAELSDLETLN